QLSITLAYEKKLAKYQVQLLESSKGSQANLLTHQEAGAYEFTTFNIQPGQD
ncbi:1596_t:CDS:2, partial [Entrophospora sp. SA101]